MVVIAWGSCHTRYERRSVMVRQLTECRNGLQGPNGSTSSRSLSPGHKLTVGTSLGRGGLATDGTGVQGRAIFFRDSRKRLGRTRLLKKPPIKHLFGAGRFGFQAIQDLLVEEGAGALSHWALLHNIVDSIQDAIGCQFALGQAIERFHFLGESIDGGGKAGTLLLKVFVLPVQHVPEQSSRFIIQIMSRRHDIVPMLDGSMVELIA